MKTKLLLRVNFCSLIGGLLVQYIWPEIVFFEKVAHKNYVVFADQPIDRSISGLLDQVDNNLRSTGLQRESSVHRIFLVSSPWRQFIIDPLRGKSFGFTRTVTRDTFLLRADAQANRAYSGNEAHNVRTLVGVLTHERTHALLGARYGMLTMLITPAWIEEGYCDYVSGETSFNQKLGARLIKTGGHDPSRSFDYFVAYVLVKYLVEIEHWSLERLIEDQPDRAAITAKAFQQVDQVVPVVQ